MDRSALLQIISGIEGEVEVFFIKIALSGLYYQPWLLFYYLSPRICSPVEYEVEYLKLYLQLIPFIRAFMINFGILLHWQSHHRSFKNSSQIYFLSSQSIHSLFLFFNCAFSYYVLLNKDLFTISEWKFFEQKI